MSFFLIFYILNMAGPLFTPYTSIQSFKSFIHQSSHNNDAPSLHNSIAKISVLHHKCSDTGTLPTQELPLYIYNSHCEFKPIPLQNSLICMLYWVTCLQIMNPRLLLCTIG